MQQTYQGYSRAQAHAAGISLPRGLGWGATGGFVGTLVMDIVITGGLWAAGLPALAGFSIIGNTAAQFSAMLGVPMAGGVPLGIAVHYPIGLAIGALFGAAVARVDALWPNGWKKSALVAVLYVELVSQPILALPPILLKMTLADTLQWYAVCIVMHMIGGAVLGVVVYYRLCSFSSANRPPAFPFSVL